MFQNWHQAPCPDAIAYCKFRNLRNAKLFEFVDDFADMQIAEKQRVQQAEVAADEFTYAAQENRTNADLDRQAGLENRYAQMEYEAKLEKENAVNEGVTEVSSSLASGEYLMPMPS